MQLYVGGLSGDTAEEELSVLFSKFGDVESVTVIRDITSGKSKGFAFIRMPGSAEGEEAIKQLNGTRLGERQIMVGRMHETLPGEMEFREWLRDNALEALKRVGVRRGHVVLDYGCGPGIFTIASARIVGEQGRVYAVEVRPQPLERVREKAEKEELTTIETILLDSSRVAMGLGDESADVILLYDVLQEVDDKQGLLREMYRVLKRDGFFSVFPMHMGTERLMEIMGEVGLFRFRDRYNAPGHTTASEVINFEKGKSE
jgi:SAM-dependent methyltransferase